MRHAYPPETPAEARALRVTGVAWLVVLALLVALSVATYAKAFDGHVTVAVDAPRTGLQLNVGGDVRMNGAIVGRISDVAATDKGARVELQLQGDKADRIPRTATATILPTTLFGQKYVELRSSADPADRGHVVDGTVLRAARDSASVELTQVLDDLQPLLTAVRPAELATLLHETAAGLDGQGATLARLIDEGGLYLGELNEERPQLVRDLRLLDEVSGQYARNVPAFLGVLDQTTRTLTAVTRGAELARALREVSGAADAGTALMAASRRNAARAAALSRPTLELLAEYSPEFPCLVSGFLGVRDSSAAQVKGGSVEGYFTAGQQVRGYRPSDRLRMGDLGTGPACRGLPHPKVPYPAVDVDDGVSPEIDRSRNPDTGGAR
ncbi:MCE family protein [Nocardioides marmoribigeumensis]|uniref:Phospholipid/cholesterol/gamma-HCH transport system substrate-binding protein n=1 Tax=Nocardioides marmoribigeumensis TaxID=433649 RepID=A0ABU2BZY4_9ACTN|nr:MCE family protein [Nocardioides marmoribigeumensis]MDR7363959.1 phospholipid/cholesterol/gamma-HCH transport system substrate-binding protein [Nocardioides marmoribigeumensis]